MATQIQKLVIDDLDGSEAKETVMFAIDGTEYEIDLSDDNAKSLRAALTPYIACARRSPAAAGRGRKRAGAPQRPSRDRSSEIRAWAKAQGLEVSERGRIASHIVARYEAAH
ncbi:histone-like nucleoid-structuring protein Lsr2 [Sphaerisporangium fuscum]|uniref:histone-like nucleoid-structuring protein Lsr2 n=1 Tax=Sphaerisporangium fuscum TaxID=2835868 RepID=UPI001BDC4D9E|nr:Lsr2 family protein [Sphaerisporangium fuscum]